MDAAADVDMDAHTTMYQQITYMYEYEYGLREQMAKHTCVARRHMHTHARTHARTHKRMRLQHTVHEAYTKASRKALGLGALTFPSCI